MNIKKVFVFTIVLLCSLCFFSCKKTSKKLSIEFDNTYPLALAPDVTWALITDPYAAFWE